ncbi:hypothetical protein B0I35DRAFT_78110 [Stachybotrys elegans]|uniref:TIL domain-containing protein n=1 Tax=Stachybotrys elegans TaxID=80388 RepID=A0A8K0SL49_9HYPO|nr:hypothetical protein B0I35DRAFT_78110 [Stachybotrys elegans]
MNTKSQMGRIIGLFLLVVCMVMINPQLYSKISQVFQKKPPQAKTRPGYREWREEPRCLQPNALWLECGTPCHPTCKEPNPQICAAVCVEGASVRKGSCLTMMDCALRWTSVRLNSLRSVRHTI